MTEIASALPKELPNDVFARRIGAALIVARRFKGLPKMRARSDISMLSALNVEVASRSPAGSPMLNLSSGKLSMLVDFARKQKPESASAGEEVETMRPLSSQEKVVGERASGSDATRQTDSDPERLNAASSSDDHSNDNDDDGNDAFLESRKHLLRFRVPLRAEPAPSEAAGFRTADTPTKMSMSRQVTPAFSRQNTLEAGFSRQNTLEAAMPMSRQETPQVGISRQVTPAPARPEGIFVRQVSATFSRQSTPMASPCGNFTRSVSETPSLDWQVGRRDSLDSTTRSSPKMFRQLSGGDELKRKVQGLLNKVCPENVSTIVHKISAVEITDTQQLETVIELIFKKALTEPHYCETYADLVFSLKSVFPEFPALDGGKPITFKSSVLNICQNEFEELLTGLEPTEEEKSLYTGEDLEACRKRRKDRMLANMKFIGHLYLRQLLSAKVIGSVSRELVSCEDVGEFPAEHALECACELLLAIGFTLETLPTGLQVVQQVCSRLYELKIAKDLEGKPAFCKRVQFMIQDLLDTRAAGWSKKSFKSSAKTKDEIRMEQVRDIIARQSGAETPSAEFTVAGQRPTYLSPM
mmetsp:Transcript_44406/g.125436  ORF Transcript_44406/g.125436 Transcript_44406/m.125436 type:complete len:584 (+) Transcript_44406:83-1834(+)